MKLKSIALKGYHGFSFDSDVALDDLAHCNIFIGPNNSGKSTIFRFLHYLKSSISSAGFQLFQEQEQGDDGWWWQHDTSQAISAQIILHECINDYGIYQKIFDKLVAHGECRIDVTLQALDEQGKSLLIVSPLIMHEGSSVPIIRQSEANAHKVEHLNRNGGYISSSGSDNCPYHEPALALIQAWVKELRFFDPIRAVDRGAGNRRMDDGAELLISLYDQQHNAKQAAQHSRFKKKLLENINHLLDPGGILSLKDFDIKGEREQPRMFFCQKDCGDIPIALEDMGTGLSELTILISAIIHDAGKRMQYFIEEPEIHLHPGLLRRFMHSLSGIANIQFFISSHSNVVLDALDVNSRIFYFSQMQNGASSVTPCKEVITQHHLLDALGVSGSTLLQTNCVIWVEGPSDRLYIRYWLNQLDATLQEGSDYCFAFYGGKILSHFAFEQDELSVENFLSMLRISRFSAVIMDKDLPPTQSLNKLRSTKRRILTEAQSDPAHRLACFTEKREIENDVPIGVFRQACAELLALIEAIWTI